MRPDQGSNLQPRYMPWPGTETTTFWCTGWCSNQMSPLARASFLLYYYLLIIELFSTQTTVNLLLPQPCVYVTYVYSWPLNSTGLNCAGSLRCIFSVNYLCCFWSLIGSPQMWRADSRHRPTLFYTGSECLKDFLFFSWLSDVPIYILHHTHTCTYDIFLFIHPLVDT